MKRFVKAYGEAFDYVIAHPDEAAAITAKATPGYEDKQDVLLAQLKADIASTFTSDDTKAHSLGWMTKEQWQQTLRVMTDQGVAEVRSAGRRDLHRRFPEELETDRRAVEISVSTRRRQEKDC